MADKSIHELEEASSVGLTDLLVIEQNNTAKKLSGQTFINQMADELSAHGGISTITKTGTSGRVDTYTITYADTTTTTFTVTNGEKGDTGDDWYVWIRYAEDEPTSDSDILTNPNDWIGIYSGVEDSPPTHYTDYTWFKFKGNKGDQGNPAAATAAVSYQGSSSGTIIPPGEWSDTVPTVQQGYYLWTRTILTIQNGNGTTTSTPYYSVSRIGIDGQGGTVNTVNNVSVDSGTNNVTLYGVDIAVNESDLRDIISYVDDKDPVATSVVLETTDWNNLQCTKTVLDMTSTRNVIVSPAPSSRDLYADTGIAAITQGEGTITFEAKAVPDDDVTVNLLMM